MDVEVELVTTLAGELVVAELVTTLAGELVVAEQATELLLVAELVACLVLSSVSLSEKSIVFDVRFFAGERLRLLLSGCS